MPTQNVGIYLFDDMTKEVISSLEVFVTESAASKSTESERSDDRPRLRSQRIGKKASSKVSSPGLC